MGCPSEVVLGDNLTFSIATHDPDTGVLTDADSVPTYRIYEDGNETAIDSGNVDDGTGVGNEEFDDANTTGFYVKTVACTTGNGYENGKTYTVYIEATVDGDKGGICYSFKAVTSIADKVWDEVLTGVAHNVGNSSGRRLRQLQEAGGYVGCIWVDTVNGSAGTTNFENGTDSNPVDNMADANTLAAALGIAKFCIASGSSITLAASQENQVFFGDNWTLALGGQSISGSYFSGASVSGTATGAVTPEFKDCHFGSATIPPSHLEGCGLEATITAGSAGTFFFDLCHSGVAGTSTPIFDFGSALNASNVNFRHYSGGIEIRNMGAGTGSYNMSLEGWGQLVINANCSATSTVAIRGAFTVTDNSGGAVTLSDDARYEKNHVADALLARDVDNDEPTGDEHTLRLLVLMATEANLEDNVGFITVYQTDGSTEVVQKAVTTDATADPVTGVS